MARNLPTLPSRRVPAGLSRSTPHRVGDDSGQTRGKRPAAGVSPCGTLAGIPRSHAASHAKRARAAGPRAGRVAAPPHRQSAPRDSGDPRHRLQGQRLDRDLHRGPAHCGRNPRRNLHFSPPGRMERTDPDRRSADRRRRLRRSSGEGQAGRCRAARIRCGCGPPPFSIRWSPPRSCSSRMLPSRWRSRWSKPGVGARLDPTRACRAVATCVTGVELEHADRLGPAIEDIAREKAAIARPGVPPRRRFDAGSGAGGAGARGRARRRAGPVAGPRDQDPSRRPLPFRRHGASRPASRYVEPSGDPRPERDREPRGSRAYALARKRRPLTRSLGDSAARNRGRLDQRRGRAGNSVVTYKRRPGRDRRGRTNHPGLAPPAGAAHARERGPRARAGQ